MKFVGAKVVWCLILSASLLPERVYGADPVKPVVVPGIVELSQVKADPPRASDPVLIDLGKSRFYRIDGYEGAITWELTSTDVLLLKEVDKPITLGLVQQGEIEPSYPEVPAGAVILWGKKPGTTDLTAWGVVAGKPKKLLTKTFTVGGFVPPAPIPDPIPVPVPAPLSAFETKLKAAATADGATSANLRLLASLYKVAASSTVTDPTLKTSGELLAEMQRAVKLLGIPSGSLDKTARAVADELNLTLAKPVNLDATARASIASLFAKIALALERVANG